MATFEFPFNEKIRAYLRLEEIFFRLDRLLQSALEQEHLAALLTLLQLLDLLERSDFKMDLIQELDRQSSILRVLRDSPDIQPELLEKTITQLQETIQPLKQTVARIGQHLRENEWLMGIKQRMIIPGGICAFETPSLHYWLNMPATKRRNDLEQWSQPFMPIRNGVAMILHLLRSSGKTLELQAHNGMYQQMMTGHKPSQLIKIEIDDSLHIYPEVSANKYAMSVRWHQLSEEFKTSASNCSPAFKLTICNL